MPYYYIKKNNQGVVVSLIKSPSKVIPDGYQQTTEPTYTEALQFFKNKPHIVLENRINRLEEITEIIVQQLGLDLN